MSMSKQDYEMLADAFADAMKQVEKRPTLTPRTTVYETAGIIARAIHRDHPRFNASQFLDAIRNRSV